MTAAVYLRAMYSVADFAADHGVSESTVRDCIRGESAAYPPLKAKRVRRPGSKRSLIYITAEAAAEWRAALADA